MEKNDQFDSDESDEDFVPEKLSDVSEEEPEVASSDDSDQDETISVRKRRRKEPIPSKPAKRREPVQKKEKEPESDTEQPDDPEEQKRAEDLWASFLSDTKKDPADVSTSKPADEKPEEEIITEVRDFAGEEVVITKKVSVTKPTVKALEKPSSTTSSESATKKPSLFVGIPKTTPKRPVAGGGLNSILGQIGKKNKITVLEKTKLDWDKFKDKEGLDEELKTYNKGKGGFLERRDFLERTDVRQFEIERDIRQTSKRSNP